MCESCSGQSHLQRLGATHSPFSEQAGLQTGVWHPTPFQPELHVQLAVCWLHVPCPEQSNAQILKIHSLPSAVSPQSQIPGATHFPTPWHPFSQIALAQSSPSQPLSHLQLSTPIHDPCPEQFPVLPEQTGVWQVNPVHPFEHWQRFGETQTPFISQPSPQTGTEHVGPVHPAKQPHLFGKIGGKLAYWKGLCKPSGSTFPNDPVAPVAVKSTSTPLFAFIPPAATW
jgi:hypothetical protein